MIGDQDNCSPGDPGDGDADQVWPPITQQTGPNWRAQHDFHIPLHSGFNAADIVRVVLRVDTAYLVCVPDRCGELYTNSPLFCVDSIEVIGSRRWDICGGSLGTRCQSTGQNLEAGESAVWDPPNNLEQQLWAGDEVIVRVDAGHLNAFVVNWIEVEITANGP
jgi:hypothetical protein